MDSQAQSLNIYLSGVSGKKIDELKAAWLKGLKTTYYLRTMVLHMLKNLQQTLMN